MDAIGFVQVKGYMDRFTYKPGYRFTVSESNDPEAAAVIRLDMDVPDSTGNDMLVFGGFLVPQGLTEEGFWKWLRDHAIDYIENHEADEWFRIDGKLFRPPHGPNVERPWGIL